MVMQVEGLLDSDARPGFAYNGCIVLFNNVEISCCFLYLFTALIYVVLLFIKEVVSIVPSIYHYIYDIQDQ